MLILLSSLWSLRENVRGGYVFSRIMQGVLSSRSILLPKSNLKCHFSKRLEKSIAKGAPHVVRDGQLSGSARAWVNAQTVPKTRLEEPCRSGRQGTSPLGNTIDKARAHFITTEGVDQQVNTNDDKVYQELRACIWTYHSFYFGQYLYTTQAKAVQVNFNFHYYCKAC